MDSDKKASSSYHHGNLKAELMGAALTVLDRDGASALSLRKLARIVGVSHNAPYMHFRDKEAVLAALAEEGWVLLTEAVEAAVSAVTGTRRWQERFDAACRAYVRFVLDHRAHSHIMFRAFSIDEFPQTASASGRALDALADIVKEGQQAGHLSKGPPYELATVIWTMLHGTATIVANGKMPPAMLSGTDGETLAVRFVQQLVDGVGSQATTDE